MYSIHLFAGAGGGILGDLLLGHTPICAVEIEEYPRKVLLQRQIDGVFPAFPIWDDVTTLQGSILPSIDLISGGRAGWNLVTSSAASEAFNFSLDAHVPHAERYERARMERAAFVVLQSRQAGKTFHDPDTDSYKERSKGRSADEGLGLFSYNPVTQAV